MDAKTRKIAVFGLLTALALVLGLLDRAVPLTALLSGAVPGIKLGLANTVLLYAVYLMTPAECVLLMLTKVVLSGLLFGSLSAILYSLSGGVLSLLVMLAVRRRPRTGALGIGLIAAGSAALILSRNPRPRGQMLWCMILILSAAAAAFLLWAVMRKKPEWHLMGTSLAGAVAHNLGQILTAAAVLHTPQLLWTYLPFLAGIGAAVGCLTGVVTQRVLRALRLLPGRPETKGEGH